MPIKPESRVMPDLFGEEIVLVPSLKKGGRGYTGGYACRPGSGPANETCKTCEHYTRLDYHNKIWLKCGLMEKYWTHGAGSDIKASSPACKMWTE